VTVSDLRAYLSIANVRAFLRVIRQGESVQTDDAYTLINGGSHFSIANGWAHPWHGIPTTQGARACGAYQFLGTTWAECADKYGLPDFTPASQDEGAVGKVIDRGALDDVIGGWLESAIARCRKEWTSLPGAAENNPRWTLAKARDLYLSYGGALSLADGLQDAGLPPAPIDEPRKGMDPLTLIGMLTSVFSPLLRAKIDKVVGTEVGKPLVDGLLGMAQTLTGKPDPLEAVAIARQQPAVVAQLEQKADDWFAQIAPAVDKIAALERGAWDAEEGSREAAAARGARMQEAGPLGGNPQFLIAVGILSMVAVVVLSVLWKDAVLAMFMGEAGLKFGFSTDMQAFVIGAIVGSSLTAIIGYFYGSTRASAAKDITIDAMARQKGR